MNPSGKAENVSFNYYVMFLAPFCAHELHQCHTSEKEQSAHKLHQRRTSENMDMEHSQFQIVESIDQSSPSLTITRHKLLNYHNCEYRY